MSKRILAGVLWLFAGWYIGNILAFYFGISDLLGPILGVAAALVIAGDPGTCGMQPPSSIGLSLRPPFATVRSYIGTSSVARWSFRWKRSSRTT